MSQWQIMSLAVVTILSSGLGTDTDAILRNKKIKEIEKPGVQLIVSTPPTNPWFTSRKEDRQVIEDHANDRSITENYNQNSSDVNGFDQEQIAEIKAFFKPPMYKSSKLIDDSDFKAKIKYIFGGDLERDKVKQTADEDLPICIDSVIMASIQNIFEMPQAKHNIETKQITNCTQLQSKDGQQGEDSSELNSDGIDERFQGAGMIVAKFRSFVITTTTAPQGNESAWTHYLGPTEPVPRRSSISKEHNQEQIPTTKAHDTVKQPGQNADSPSPNNTTGDDNQATSTPARLEEKRVEPGPPPSSSSSLHKSAQNGAPQIILCQILCMLLWLEAHCKSF